MNNFPEYQHFGVEIIFTEDREADENLTDSPANSLISSLKLKVVSQGKYKFTNHELTKFWVLS